MAETFNWEHYHQSHRTLTLGERTVRCALGGPDDDSRMNGRTVLLVPGLTSGTSIFGPFAHELHKRGYKTVAMSHDRVDQDCATDVMEVAERIITGELGDDEGTHLSIAAHSLGAILTVKGLAERPDIEEYIHTLTLAAPAGYGGVQFLRGAVESVLFELSHRPSTQEVRHTIQDALRYSLAANIQLRDRINEARHTTIIPETQELLAKGLPIMALTYPNDRLIHHGALIEGLEQAGVPVVKTVQPPSYLGHNAHLYFPEKVVAIAMEGIAELEEGRA